MQPWVLGVNTSHHDGSMCLLKGDEIIVAIQEERLTRSKRDGFRYPKPLALNYCLEYAGISAKDLNLVVGCGVAPQQQTAQWLKVILPNTPILTLPHHLGHAIGAFATSGFEEAAILVVDGAGSPVQDLPVEERRNLKPAVVPNQLRSLEIISLYHATGTQITSLEKHIGDWLSDACGREVRRFGSLGGLYASVGEIIFGHSPLVGELAGKVMGLAAYGKPQIPSHDFFDFIDDRFVFHSANIQRFSNLAPFPAHESIHKTLAASVQAALEEALLLLVKRLKELCPSNNLVFTGGVALNSVANERIVREGSFKNIYFMPIAEDSGNAIGAAYYGLWQLTQQNTKRPLVHDTLGKSYGRSEIDGAIKQNPSVTVRPSADIISQVVELLIEGKIIGWFQGRSELGPRALGQRSILCDPRRIDGKEYVNRRVKHREDFRPFAPSVLLEEAHNWFELDNVEPDCPFMLRVCRFRHDKKSLVPAVVHADGTGRVQTVTRLRNGIFYELVHAFYKRTGVPILLNTSFNIMGEPIVETPEDALWCMLCTGIDYCVLESKLVAKVSARSSILDLRPQITVAQCKFKSCDSEPNSTSISFLVKNQWGEFNSTGRAEWLPLLELIDGAKTGWVILAQLQQKNISLSATWLIQTFGLLRRCSIIDFY